MIRLDTDCYCKATAHRIRYRRFLRLASSLLLRLLQSWCAFADYCPDIADFRQNAICQAFYARRAYHLWNCNVYLGAFLGLVILGSLGCGIGLSAKSAASKFTSFTSFETISNTVRFLDSPRALTMPNDCPAQARRPPALHHGCLCRRPHFGCYLNQTRRRSKRPQSFHRSYHRPHPCSPSLQFRSPPFSPFLLLHCLYRVISTCVDADRI